jgi:hypothetical protein
MFTKDFEKARVKLGNQVGVEPGGQIVNSARSETAEVVVLLAAGIVPCRTGPAMGRQSMRRADGHQGFKGLVNGCQTDPWDSRADRMEDLFGRRVIDRAGELIVDRQALRSATQASGLEGRAKGVVMEGGERRQTVGILSIGSGNAPNHGAVSASQWRTRICVHIVRTLDSAVNSLIN